MAALILREGDQGLPELARGIKGEPKSHTAIQPQGRVLNNLISSQCVLEFSEAFNSHTLFSTLEFEVFTVMFVGTLEMRIQGMELR